jgi:tRNA-(ms[2]io[6]A)-hydroxylase
LPATPEDDADLPRSPWQWVGFGTLAIFVVWLPLASLSQAAAGGACALLKNREDVPMLAVLAGASALSLGLASMAGGFLLGKWGARGVGVHAAALSGLAAAGVAALVSWRSFSFATSIVVAAIATAFSALGGQLGLRRRT